jgi:hypothetical protein
MTMSDMIERVAIAMHKGTDIRLDWCRQLAPIAIKAMRDPTEAMVAAGTKADWDDDPIQRPGIWQAMIDVALDTPIL